MKALRYFNADIYLFGHNRTGTTTVQEAATLAWKLVLSAFSPFTSCTFTNEHRRQARRWRRSLGTVSKAIMFRSPTKYSRNTEISNGLMFLNDSSRQGMTSPTARTLSTRRRGLYCVPE